MNMPEAQRTTGSRKLLQFSELKTESTALEEQFDSFWRSL